ncbi:MAG: helix-turn-helix transcriptional regulator [Dehalococcoidia bacterium]|nr:helix-turn-helix transcriptional regulator [Dehalococcoidia bacterium]
MAFERGREGLHAQNWQEPRAYEMSILEDEEKIMRRHEVEDSHAEWLEDIEYRQEFGSEAAKLEVAAALADAREAAGMTQSALAERAGVSQAYIAKLERGDANPTIGHIGRLLACMGLKPSVSVAPMEPAASSEPVHVESERASKLETVSYNGPLAEVAGSSVEQPLPAV